MKAGKSGTFDWDIQKNVNVWSPEIEELYGVAPGEFGGTFEAWEKLVLPEDLASARAAVDESLKTGELKGEWRIRHASDGRIHWLRARARVFFDEDGNPTHMIGINVDITEQMGDREALQRSEQTFREVIANAPIVVFREDLEGRLTFIEGRDADALGLGPGRGIGQRVSDLFREDLPDAEAMLQKVLSGTPLIGRFRTKGRVFEAHIAPQRDAHGAIVGVMGVATDVTELTRAEERFATAFHAAPFALLITTVEDGRFLDLNAASTRILGYEREELLGRTSVETGIWPGAEDRARFMKLIREHGRVAEFPCTLRTRSGELRSFMISSETTNLDGTPCLIGTLRDVTDWKVLQRKLVESERLASMGQFAGFIAHQMNTPLTNIALLASSIEKRVTDPAVLEKMGKIDAQRRIAAAILADLMSFARQRDLKRTDIDVREVVDMACAQVEPYRKPTVSLLRELPGTSVSARLDAPKVQEALVNLLKNAFEATEAGMVTVVLERRGELVSLSVSDTGTGILPEDLPRLFQPFFTTKRDALGTGLGLPLCKTIAEAHGGRVEVQTEVGKGSTFTILLPADGSAP